MSRKAVMERDPDEMGLFSLATFQTMRLEALDLFDRSLADGKPEHLERFLDHQIALEPPPLELLSQIAEDIHQRLLALRQRHFDNRDQLRLTLQRQYGLDLSPFLPTDPVEYHRLNLDAALDFFSREQPHLSEDSRLSLRLTLREALVSAATIHRQLMLADQLYIYLIDWLMALHIVSVRGAWADDLGDTDHLPVH